MSQRALGVITALLIVMLAGGQSPAQAASVSYYLSANGNDANPGTITQPWRSLGRLQTVLNSGVLKAGDQVLFARGDRFSGTLTLNAGVSGTAIAPITFGAYGTGSTPVLSGMQSLSGWQSLGNNQWRAVCSACTITPSSLLIDGVPQPLARWPNLDEGDRGYRYYDSFSGRNSITDNTLPANPNWTGGELVLRTVAWVLDRLPIASHAGGTLATAVPASYDIGVNGAGYGYFIQNHLAALDRDGEWVYAAHDKSLTMQWPVNPGTLNVEIPVAATLVQLSGSRYVTFQDLELRGAQNNLLDASGCANLVVQRIALRYAGNRSLSLAECSSSLVSESVIVDSMNAGLAMFGCADCRVNQMTVERIGVLAGMGGGGDTFPAYTGMQIAGASAQPAIVENSIVSGTGYIAISHHGPAITRQNIVRDWNRVLTDGAGIYMWHQTDGSILDNIVLDAEGSTAGTPYSSTLTHGIYIDDDSERITVSGNTIARVSGAGIVLHNTRDVTVTNNLVFDTREAGLWLIDDDYSAYALERSLISGNTVLVAGVPMIDVSSSQTASLFDALGPINNNLYCDPFGPPEYRVALPGAGRVAKSLAQWRTDYARDLTSTVCPDRHSSRIVTGVTGANRVGNGTFDSDLDGWFGYPLDTLDAVRETGQLDGGNLRLAFKKPAPYFIYEYVIGTVQTGQNYRLRLSAIGISGAPSLLAYLLQNGPPFARLSETRPLWVESQRTEHEVFLDVSANEADTQLVFEMDSPGGAVGIDNVVLEAVTATRQSLAGVTRCQEGALYVAGSTATLPPGVCFKLLAMGVSPPLGSGSDYSRNYVQKAYVAYYGRPADPGGQGYWASRMDAEGQSLNAIIGAFGTSDEFSRRYGGLGHTQLVTRIYQQTLGRNPDPAGLDYYVGELQAGRRTLQSITLDVLNGATTVPDATVVANKLGVAAYYTAMVAAGCAYGAEQDGVNALSGVTSVPATVAAAKASIDSRCWP